ncbi:MULTISPECIES: hypothetical protein [Enterococcus]|uniref:Lipoprotein n=1 Tax=Candidatus Enterococcus willemsii TaxID=1857215 RepID=A0ABQ6Z2L9_9ENTE|nr:MULTISPECIES: hypothetical protein [Enterococcus]KAF1305614.1 hypothetical protein BAU17_13405 [Enterococcus sp. CU12B]
MKKYVSFFSLGCLMLFLSACQNSPEVIDAKKDVSTETTTATLEATPKSVLLIQKKTAEFPQSQGVYDYNQGKLTVVKQYHSNKNKDTARVPENSRELIKQDFAENFSQIEWEEDPFKVYEEKYQQVELTIDQEKIDLYTNDFEKTFYFEPTKRYVYDENNVFYTVQYD